MNFKIGDKVIYPNQGIGVIEEVCQQSIGGSRHEFYRLKLEASNSTVMVPTANAEHVGLRLLCNNTQVDRLIRILEHEECEPNPDWKNRYKDNLERMKTGSIFEVAKVFKNLFFLSFQKSLSFREKRMLDRARQLVVTEIATVREEPVETVELLVDELLTTSYERVRARTV